jgi:uncharacterized membrane protein
MTAEQKSKWRWLKIIVGSVAAVLVAIHFLSTNSLELELTRVEMWPGDGGKALDITNVGSKPITIMKITINDRADCSVHFAFNDDITKKPSPSGTLEVGEKATYSSSCPIIRAKVETDQGSETFSFQGN